MVELCSGETTITFRPQSPWIASVHTIGTQVDAQFDSCSMIQTKAKFERELTRQSKFYIEVLNDQKFVKSLKARYDSIEHFE